MGGWPERVRSGVADLDELLDGLILGDNVVLVTEAPDLARRLEDALITESLARGQRCFYVSASVNLPKLRDRLPPQVTVLDARPRGEYADPALLETTLVEGSRGSPPGCVVVDALEAFARRWGHDRAVAFFSRVCPRLFDLGALAYWRASREDLSRAFIERVTKVTQCVLELGEDHLKVVKAEGRPASVQGRLLRLRVDDGRIVLEDERALGRLGRGLEQIRRQRNLSQTDLARLGRVSPSAISQAEGGRRGLSLDTLLTLADGLGVGLDELLASTPLPGYVLGRHHRGASGIQTALLDDPTVGLRAYLVRLKPGQAAAPEGEHKGAELVLVASGLVQVTIGDDTPVMRAGDVALATRARVTGWRNLVNEPALLFWVLRD
ncbi:MAG: helix-turn-helix domain-containing protein [Actinomycetota bacterium]|nr:helix-turn-helix domain-containing protein [Actinomycetota bacterium]